MNGNLTSTFDDSVRTPFKQAITSGRPGTQAGISKEALFYRTPESIQHSITPDNLDQIVQSLTIALKNPNTAGKTVKNIFVELWLALETGFTREQIERVVENLTRFKSPLVVPIEAIPGEVNNFFLNEALGPTDAFKDLALQMLTQMVAIIVEEENTKNIKLAKSLHSTDQTEYETWCIGNDKEENESTRQAYDMQESSLKSKMNRGEVAKPKLKFIITQTSTSGDTGPAGQSGILDKNFIINVVGYPVSEATYAQRGQMQENSRANVVAIPYVEQFSAIQDSMKDTPEGWKNTLKTIIEEELKELIEKYGFEIEVDAGSFNSINPGRIDGQMNYHAYGLLQAQAKGLLSKGGEITEVVPSGNGGHVFGVLMAREMTGIKGDTIITCNANDLFYQIIEQGKFRKPAKDSATHQPSVSMIIEYPNNMWRLFSYAFGADIANDIATRFMKGEEITLSPEQLHILKNELRLKVIKTAGELELREIGETFKKTGRLICPHTANAKRGLTEHRKATDDTTNALISETASPWKFLAAVAAGLSFEDVTFCEITYDEYRKKEKTQAGCQELIEIIKAKYKKYGYTFDENIIPENLRRIYTQGYDEPTAKSVSNFYPDTKAFLEKQVVNFRAQVEEVLNSK